MPAAGMAISRRHAGGAPIASRSGQQSEGHDGADVSGAPALGDLVGTDVADAWPVLTGTGRGGDGAEGSGREGMHTVHPRQDTCPGHGSPQAAAASTAWTVRAAARRGSSSGERRTYP